MTGEQLQTKRLDLGLTQKALAEKLGVAPNTVARWESERLAVPAYVGLALKGLEADIAKGKK